MGTRFWTADVSALYTNISSSRCIDNIMEFASEHEDDLDLLGLKLTDIHLILDHILANSYFTYDRELYIQLDGLFMGLRPSPIGAVVRMYTLERESIFIDIRRLPVYYKRYIDDAGGCSETREAAQRMIDSVAERDEEGRIVWELDFPEDSTTYTPFLNSEVRVDPDGSISSRLYRKPTKKLITLHTNSHQPDSVKSNTIRNSYREARQIASGPTELEYSLQMVDKLYRANGFGDPRRHDTAAESNPLLPPPPRPNPPSNLVNLHLDFIDMQHSHRIRNEIKRLDLPIRVNFTSKTKLRNVLCSSRPRDKRICMFLECKICPLIITANKDCSVKNIVYKVNCNICNNYYIGESERPAHFRFGEHKRYATYPLTESNKKEAFSIHYTQCHPDAVPNLNFEILYIEPNTVRRKIYEAYALYDI